ncbi:MAG TPA: hypothetical protein VMZ03_01125 [Chitinophagaceae bacterium]|nr:hypothetical protein [Chitinophagaceae bacterium]
MRNFILIAIALIFIVACSENKKEKVATLPIVKTDLLLITDSSWGSIKPTTDIEALKAAYGPTNIEDRRVCDLECQDSINVTILYPGSKNESTIYWKDSGYHKIIDRIECYMDSTDWHTSNGIKIGSGLSDLVKLNGKKINFYGFGWDYGGTITSYNEGALEHSQIFYILTFGDYNADKLIGEIGLDSDMQEVKDHMDKIIIRSISLVLNRSEL